MITSHSRTLVILLTSCVMLVFVSLGGKVACAQQKTNRDLQARSAQVDSLIANASAAMPEVAADMLIKIAESSLVRDRQRKIELLEEAFRRSGEVQQKYRRKLWDGPVDSRGGYLSAAFDQQIDSLSLRCRVVRAMLSLDAERARTLFSEIPAIKLDELSCKQSLAYDLAGFYETISLVAAKSFSAAEIQQGERLRFIRSHVETVHSPAQISPVINLLIDSSVSAADLSVIGKAFSSALSRVAADRRSFTASVLHNNLITNTDRLLRIYRDHDLPMSELISSFQSYLLRQLNSDQCADIASSKSTMKQIWANLDRFNAWLNDPIQPKDIKPSRIDHLDTGEQFWTSSRSSELLMKLKALTFGDGKESLTIETRRANDWQQKMELLLADVEGWDGTSENNALTYFHEKANLYARLLELAPSRESKMRVLLKFAGFWRNSEAREKSSVEWLLHLHGLLKIIKRLDPTDRTRILDVVKNSGNHALQLYSDFDLLLVSPSPKKS